MVFIDAKWIKAQLELGNGTRRGLADHMRVGRDIVSKILSGTRQIKASELPAIADYFGIGSSASPEDATEIVANLPDFDGPGGHDSSESWRRLMDRLALLTPAELDYLSVAAEGLHARRSQQGNEE